MSRQRMGRLGLLMVLVAFGALAPRATAHCDAVDGPVAKDAKKALAARDAAPVLKWVEPESQAEVKAALADALKLAAAGEDARRVSEARFLETLVRLHRAAEGAAYTGIKPAGQSPAVIRAADQALAGGDVDALAHHVAQEVEKQIRERFAATYQAQGKADRSVAEGREFVARYVDFMHYLVAIQRAAGGHEHEAVKHEE